MSQFPLDPESPVPAADAAGEQQTPKPARRRRHASSRTNAASRAEATAPAVEQPIAQPAQPAQPSPAQEVQAASQLTAAQDAEAPATPAASKPRGQRPRRASGRRSAVQLVKPAGTASAPADVQTETAEPVDTLNDRDTTARGAREARVVPVTTEQAIDAGVSAGQTTAAPHTLEAAPPAVPAPAPEPQRRYRFERRSQLAPAAPPARGERLSGPLGIAGLDETPTAAPLAPDVAPELEAEPTLAVTPDDLTDFLSQLGLQSPSAATETRAVTPEPSLEEAPEAEAAETDGETAGAEGEQPTGTRRRRRRRRSSGHAAGTEDDAEERAAAEAIHGFEAAPADLAATPYVAAEPDTRNGHDAEEPLGSGYGYPGQQPYSPYTRAAHERATNDAPWDIATGQQRALQPESPFGSPEPSFARGFGPQPRGVAGPARETYPRTARPERGTDAPPMSPNVLASTVTHAIQQQTDRLLNELRHQANPPAMTVMFPPFPSTERVGVFVDVANLLYSSRNLRVNLDFGRLLDFLRGNRRLVRAHAYAPTDPDPRADQSFLNAVKGYGYRITTKNYKTFSSGAKKADMDLDLCMDVVRLVDAQALDTVSLVSGDSDFLPLLEYCSDHGVRVEVAAFEDSAAMILRQSCDVFINLSLVEDIRG